MAPSDRVQIEIRERLFHHPDEDPVGWEVVRYARSSREVLAEGTSRQYDDAWLAAREASAGLGVEVLPCP